MPLLFVYGTLRPGQAAHHRLGPCRVLGPARTLPRWSLVSLGLYPGLCPGGHTSIVGELVEVSADALPRLDVYEGDEYARVPVALEPPHAGLIVEAWVFTARRAGTPIPSGDWAAWAAAHPEG